jgi:hypothetical protein
MALRKSQLVITGLGAALLLGSYFSFNAWLRHADLSSAHWVDPNPVTQWERFWMTIPARYLPVVGLMGLMLLIVALIRFAIQKSS